MGAAVATVTVLPDEASRKPDGKGQHHGNALTPVQLRDGVYLALRRSMDVYPGGIQRFAEDIDASQSDTYARIGRKEDQNGRLQRAFLDYLGPLFADRPSALCFIGELNKLLDLEPPVSRRRATDGEVGRAWLEVVRRMPAPYRSAAVTEMAHQLGMRVDDVAALL
jgi:hypothetical protein